MKRRNFRKKEKAAAGGRLKRQPKDVAEKDAARAAAHKERMRVLAAKEMKRQEKQAERDKRDEAAKTEREKKRAVRKQERKAKAAEKAEALKQKIAARKQRTAAQRAKKAQKEKKKKEQEEADKDQAAKEAEEYKRLKAELAAENLKAAELREQEKAEAAALREKEKGERPPKKRKVQAESTPESVVSPEESESLLDLFRLFKTQLVTREGDLPDEVIKEEWGKLKNRCGGLVSSSKIMASFSKKTRLPDHEEVELVQKKKQPKGEVEQVLELLSTKEGTTRAGRGRAESDSLQDRLNRAEGELRKTKLLQAYILGNALIG